MTKEDWQAVEKALTRQLEYVELICDSYLLHARLQQISPTKLSIVVYVDGKFRGKWLLNDCEQRKRFFRPIKRFIYSSKERKRLKKYMSKRRLKEANINPDECVTYFAWDWTSAKSLIRHLKANNTSIELEEETRKRITHGRL